MQVIMGEEYSERAREIRTTEQTVFAKRGTIYDRNGNVLAMSVKAIDIYANIPDIADVNATAKELAGVLGGDVDYYADLLNSSKGFVYIERRADVERAEAVQARCDQIQKEIDSSTSAVEQTNALDGIYYLQNTKRVYPYGQIAGQIIGYVGNDGQGLSGLELYYDDILSGTNGSRVVEHGRVSQDAETIQIPGGVKEDVPAVDGTDIMISIDISLQEYAEGALVDQCAAAEANTGTFVVIDGDTGEIYAAASTPLYDLNNVGEAEEGAETLKAASWIYEPGSIFKTVTAAALLEKGLATPSEELTVPGYLDYGQWTITDAHDHDTQTMTFKEIIEQSSNIGVAMLEDRIGTQEFYNWLIEFGFGQKTGLDYPSDSSGILASCDTWSEVQEANISFGQGLAVTSIQMASFYGTVASGGIYVQPHFLIGYPGTQETVEYQQVRKLSESTCAQLTDMLVGVVTDGTGEAAAVEGYQVAGKTGTSQKVTETGEYSQGAYVISFDGYLGNTDSSLACVVSVDNPVTSAAMPIFSQIMTTAAQMYRVTPNS